MTGNGNKGNLLQRLKYLAGLDILSDKYAYDRDPEQGYMAKEKIPERWVRTTCGYCSVGCGMEIGVREGKAVSVRGDSDHPVNRGRLCPKGLSEHYILQASNRAVSPMLQMGGKLSPVDWQKALSWMARSFREAKDHYGPEAMAIIGTGQLVTEEFYALGKLARLGMGVAHNDGNTTLCMASAVMGYKRSFGSDGPPGAYEDLEKADVIFLIGANIADNHPILCYRLGKNRQSHLIVADPRVTKTAMMADRHLPLKSRSDVALLNGLAHLLIRWDMVNKAFVEAHTDGFDQLKESVDHCTPEWTAEATGLSVGQILETAQKIGNSKALLIAWTMGVNHSTQGTETVNAICNLSLLLGQVGKVGAAPFSITGQCNAMGTRESGFTASMPGYRDYANEQHRRELAELWKVPEELMPRKRGFAYPDIIEGVLRGKIRWLWIIGTNPLVSFPNQKLLNQALGNLDALIVQDGYHPTPTTALADLVLPAAIWGEKEGTYTNSERRVSKVNKAVEPPGLAKSDFDIFLDFAKELGVAEMLYPGWTGPKDAYDEIRRVSDGRPCDVSGLSYEVLEICGPLQWPFREGDKPYGERRLYEDGKFNTPDGKAKFHVVVPVPMPEAPSPQYPFLLNTGRTVEHWHTGTKTRQVPLLEALSPEAWVEINPVDARALGVEQGDFVKLVSPRGQVDKILARVTGIVPPGQVFVPFHYHEANANNLTLNLSCPISREPNFKQCAVRVEPQDDLFRVKHHNENINPLKKETT